MPQPFKVCAYEPGAANVLDRATSTAIGFVLQDFHGRWEAFTGPGESTLHSFARRADAAAYLHELSRSSEHPEPTS